MSGRIAVWLSPPSLVPQILVALNSLRPGGAVSSRSPAGSPACSRGRAARRGAVAPRILLDLAAHHPDVALEVPELVDVLRAPDVRQDLGRRHDAVRTPGEEDLQPVLGHREIDLLAPHPDLGPPDIDDQSALVQHDLGGRSGAR